MYGGITVWIRERKRARSVGVGCCGRMAVTGSQTSKKSSSFAAEDDSALSGLERVGLFCLTLELAAIDQAR